MGTHLLNSQVDNTTKIQHETLLLATFLVAGLDNFKNYGCWCYLDGAPGKGRSNPIDEFDLRCKTLHGGYECIQHDAISENDFDCVPWEQDYEFQSQNQDVTASCQNSN